MRVDDDMGEPMVQHVREHRPRHREGDVPRASELLVQVPGLESRAPARIDSMSSRCSVRGLEHRDVQSGRRLADGAEGAPASSGRCARSREHGSRRRMASMRLAGSWVGHRHGPPGRRAADGRRDGCSPSWRPNQLGSWGDSVSARSTAAVGPHAPGAQPLHWGDEVDDGDPVASRPCAPWGRGAPATFDEERRRPGARPARAPLRARGLRRRASARAGGRRRTAPGPGHGIRELDAEGGAGAPRRSR